MKAKLLPHKICSLILLCFAASLFCDTGHSLAGETPKSTPEEKSREEDPCRVSIGLENDFLSRVSRGLYTSVCATSRWFDTFFGDARAHDEYSDTYGSVSVGLKWTEYDHFEPILRARINLDLPNASRKLKLFVGRVDPEEYVRDSEDLEGGAVPVNLRNENEQWIVGLGTTPFRSHHKRLSFQVGLQASLPLDPYAKTQYRWYHEFNSRRLFRYRQTLFWYRKKGFGTTTNLDLEYRPQASTLFRLSGRATVYEESKGVEWRNSLVAFHRLDPSKALGCRLWIEGKTKAEVPLEEYGAWVFFRRRLHRKWLFTDIGSGVSWPREKLTEKRESSWGVSVGLQIQFGSLIEGGGRPEDLEESPVGSGGTPH